jgi:hypothetical protein
VTLNQKKTLVTVRKSVSPFFLMERNKRSGFVEVLQEQGNASLFMGIMTLFDDVGAFFP